jgi:hypothetical protein
MKSLERAAPAARGGRARARGQLELDIYPSLGLGF